MPDLTGPRISSLLAADHAEALNGKLYIMGGGFETMYVMKYPAAIKFSIAAMITVPWEDSNRRFSLKAWCESADGEPLPWRIEGEMETGRPPGKRGGDLSVAFAGPIEFNVEEPTDFVVFVEFGADRRRLPIQMLTHPNAPAVQPG